MFFFFFSFRLTLSSEMWCPHFLLLSLFNYSFFFFYYFILMYGVVFFLMLLCLGPFSCFTWLNSWSR